MSVDRSKAPKFSLPTEFALPAPQHFQLGCASSEKKEKRNLTKNKANKINKTWV